MREKSSELPVSVPRIVTALYIPPRPCFAAPKLPDDGDFPKPALGNDGGARFGGVEVAQCHKNVLEIWNDRMEEQSSHHHLICPFVLFVVRVILGGKGQKSGARSPSPRSGDLDLGMAHTSYSRRIVEQELK